MKLDSSLFIPISEENAQTDVKEKKTTKRQTKPKVCEE